ncbi:transcriptional regulator [Bacillus cereus]|uniref:Transcriptional regulator n=1 Tax=Bacillus cereus TaxID=1396 RepID=A0A2B1D853_BACCE|nr:metalloregulator ArsR/SmtB family transcription factor [Bacillus cereus]PEC86593.1 transcriptional regulator [Bacillus cereus]PEQ53157.1 transcriptional regulator [Bacillus cereus]PEX38523.1 transcriptional regulator [Bacillus cereus]PFB16461.1 transcriptional regulator [Bacillus cereus]PFC72696.1 transcriptional regulator [Bacillus cereus]
MNRILDTNIDTQIPEDDIELLKTMAHPLRLQIISELTNKKTLNVTQLTQILNIPQSTTSQHLSKLKRNVLRAERKGLEVYYSINNSKADKIVEILNVSNMN